MNINIKAKKITLSDEIKDYIQKKMDMLEKYLGDISVIHCDFEVELSVGDQNSGKIYRAEANIDVPGELLRVDKAEEDLYKAIDKVKDHLEMVIKKYKGKKLSQNRRA
jgi:putative sigma-54 modulation protein